VTVLVRVAGRTDGGVLTAVLTAGYWRPYWRRGTDGRTDGGVERERPSWDPKDVNYVWRGWSQRKLWWRTVAILTWKLIV